jgi:hypothetical protein
VAHSPGTRSLAFITWRPAGMGRHGAVLVVTCPLFHISLEKKEIPKNTYSSGFGFECLLLMNYSDILYPVET